MTHVHLFALHQEARRNANRGVESTEGVWGVDSIMFEPY